MGALSRRDFLRRGGRASVIAGTAHALTGCSGGTSPPTSPTTDRASVAAVTGLDLGQMARDALDACGGASSIVQPGETVFIKANFCAAGLVNHNVITSGDSTKPEIVIAVAEECLKAGAAKVTIGDAAQVARYSWEDLVTLDGATNLKAEAERLQKAYGDRITLACLNSESPGWDMVSTYTALRTVKVSSLVARADRVISIPVLKTHRWTQITASMKNFVGVTSVNDYGWGGAWRFRLHQAGIEQSFLDIVQGVKPDFALVDCSIGCEGNGPHVLPGVWGTTVDMRDRLGSWLVLAGKDLAAVDATAARVIGQDPGTVKHLGMAYEQGLGQIKEDRIDLSGARLEDIRTDWTPASPTDGFWDVLIPGIRMLTEA